jgi:hypothetical protein
MSSFTTSHRYSHRSSLVSYPRGRYTRLLRAYRQGTLSLTDSFVVPSKAKVPLVDSTVLNTLWSANEKERFFTALARCGKGNLSEVSRRVGTKSLAEVAAYVDLLDEETKLSKHGLRRHGQFDMDLIPAAMEINDNWLAFEEKMAIELGMRSDREIYDETLESNEIILNVDMANELARW